MNEPDYSRYWDTPRNERGKQSRERDEDDCDVKDDDDN